MDGIGLPGQSPKTFFPHFFSLSPLLLRNTIDTNTTTVKLGGVTDAPEGHTAIHKDLNRLEKYASRNLMKFIKGNAESCIGEEQPHAPANTRG